MNDVAQTFPTVDSPGSESKASALAVRMGQLLMQTGKVSKTQINAIMKLQAKEGLRFGDAAAKLGLADDEDIKAILAKQFAYPSLDTDNKRLSRCLTSAFRPDSAAAEALRSLRSELMLRYFNTAEQKGLVLIGADDARSIAHTSANLAISFAQTGARTLLIDADLRQPQLHAWFGIGNHEPGLSDLLSGQGRVYPSAIEDLGPLWLLSAGTKAPNPQELLSGRHYKECMQPLSEAYDVVLINTPPMNTTRDAQMVVAQTGAAVLITRENHTRMKDIVEVCENLQGLGVRLLGTALYQ